jgi:hypothetical protein
MLCGLLRDEAPKVWPLDGWDAPALAANEGLFAFSRAELEAAIDRQVGKTPCSGRKLGQLQSFIAVFLLEYGQLAYYGPT